MRGYQLKNSSGCTCASCMADDVYDAIEQFRNDWYGVFNVIADFNGVDDDSLYNVDLLN
jgi:hypothetical protein